MRVQRSIVFALAALSWAAWAQPERQAPAQAPDKAAGPESATPADAPGDGQARAESSSPGTTADDSHGYRDGNMVGQRQGDVTPRQEAADRTDAAAKRRPPADATPREAQAR